ncbi:acyltransferase domain-containing protein|uniref:Bacillaene synthase trans-acting acyltransferase n=2 Tax=Dendrosporobacter quercicolus TaxID=146817 RepID=A0A1G9NED1_9FIRM|nr:acyltransferase domain-containing protein [Dendrosporobacter quercicolus DSM 1736]SDL84754.1 bacillaene synthase trans-acting acyltransferase [Dendrosporobacter quercicolus]
MNKPIVFMFSGQGSQYYHMGKELYRQNAVFRHWLTKLNDIAYQYSGLSMIDEIYNQTKSKADSFKPLLYTHPGIFMVEYSLARVLIERGIEPDYVLGASLGEFAAAAVAGVVAPEDALICILEQAAVIERHCQTGSMIAILHNLKLLHQAADNFCGLELAAVNYSSHFVIAGDHRHQLNIEKYLQLQRIPHFVLPVGYGFHSQNIQPAGGEYKKFLYKKSFGKPKIPMISCLLSDRITDIRPEFFWDIVRQPVLFQRTILKLEEHMHFRYIDLGPSGTLANFVKYSLAKGSASQFYDILTPFDQEMAKLKKF